MKVELASRRPSAHVAHAPALLVASSAVASGSLEGGATFAGAVFGVVALVAFAWFGRGGAADPLALGRGARWLPLLFWGWTLVCWQLSPVPRAGRTAVALLPLLALAVAATARSWTSAEDRARGARSLTVVVAAVAAWALVGRLVGDDPRASAPLGHHNLLAGWLVLLLPLALTPALGAARRWRPLGVAAGVLGAAALIASGSLAGTVALGLEAMVLAWWWPTTRHTLLPAGLLALIGGIGYRLSGGLGGDFSMGSRAVYAAAGLDGIAARPVTGWGPGSTAWTIGQHLAPRPGVSPAGEVVGDLHSLPIALGYELGVVGLTLAVCVFALLVIPALRGVRRSAAPLPVAGLCGLLGGAVFALGNSQTGVAALAVAAAVTTGAATAGIRGVRPPGRAAGALVALICLVAVGGLAPGLWAMRHYERARRSEDPRVALERAAELDPRFPLYRWRLALAAREPRAGQRAGLALAAAREAPGVGPLWLVAGRMGLEEDAPWAASALRRACWLDPLSGLAPFLLAVSLPAEERPAALARALAGEPRLAAADLGPGVELDLDGAIAELRRRPAIATAWVDGLELWVRRLPPPGGERRALELAFDDDPALSLSLYAFRRRPWPAALLRVPVRRWRDAGKPPAAWSSLPSARLDSIRSLGCGSSRGPGPAPAATGP